MNEREHNLDRQTNRQDSRLYLDIVKGIAIFLMLWGHCIQYCTNGEIDFFENPVFKCIYSFHMPLFMIVSGYLFFFSCQKRNLKELIVHRTQALLQPIVFCSILNYFITIVVTERKIEYVVGALWLKQLDSLWFLWSILSASIVLAIISKISANIIFKICIVFLGLGFVCLFPNWGMNLYMYPYFIVGFYFAKYKERIPRLIINLKYFSLIAFPLMMFFYERKHYIYTTGIFSSSNTLELIAIDLYRWMVGFLGSVFVFLLIEIVYKAIIEKKPTIVKPISSLGKKSLQMYCISVSLLSFWLPIIFGKVCGLIGRNIFVSHMWFYNFVFTPIIAIVYAIILYYIVKLLERIKVGRLIFGR